MIMATVVLTCQGEDHLKGSDAKLQHEADMRLGFSVVSLT